LTVQATSIPPPYTYTHTTSGGDISGSLAIDEQTDDPRVTIRVHDSLEIVTRIEVEDDSSISINIYNHPIQPRTPPHAPIRVIRRVNPFQNFLRSSIVTAQQQRENPFQTPRATAIVATQERMRRARSARNLPRSTRTWNLRNAVAQANSNDIDPLTPPLTYQAAMLASRIEANVRDMNGNQFLFFSLPSAREELPTYTRNEHDTSSDDSVQDDSPVSPLAEPYQSPMSSSPISPLYPVPETAPDMPGTPRIEGQEPVERNPFADLLI
jgi:hypothetical protein